VVERATSKTETSTNHLKTVEDPTNHYHEMVFSYHSVFHSLCSVPEFRSFHVPSLWIVPVFVCIIHCVRFLVCLYFWFPWNISRYSSVFSDTVILPDTVEFHDST
jgi:hypothetical protein